MCLCICRASPKPLPQRNATDRLDSAPSNRVSNGGVLSVWRCIYKLPGTLITTNIKLMLIEVAWPRHIVPCESLIKTRAQQLPIITHYEVKNRLKCVIKKLDIGFPADIASFRFSISVLRELNQPLAGATAAGIDFSAFERKCILPFGDYRAVGLSLCMVWRICEHIAPVRLAKSDTFVLRNLSVDFRFIKNTSAYAQPPVLQWSTNILQPSVKKPNNVLV